MIRLKKLSKTAYQVFFNNTISLGKFIMDVDGFFYWDGGEKDGGLLGSHPLKMIANKLDELNQPYVDKLNLEFSKNNK